MQRRKIPYVLLVNNSLDERFFLFFRFFSSSPFLSHKLGLRVYTGREETSKKNQGTLIRWAPMTCSLERELFHSCRITTAVFSDGASYRFEENAHVLIQKNVLRTKIRTRQRRRTCYRVPPNKRELFSRHFLSRCIRRESYHSRMAFGTRA